MTVKELIKHLEEYNPDDVVKIDVEDIHCQNCGYYTSDYNLGIYNITHEHNSFKNKDIFKISVSSDI